MSESVPTCGDAPAWLTCDHRDAKVLGCPACDWLLDPATVRERFQLQDYVSSLTTELAAAKRALDEATRALEAVAGEPHGVGPWTRVGGEPPEPWPGMGIKVSDRNGWAMYLSDPVCVDGVVYATTVGKAEALKPAITWRLDEVAEVWRDHICIWKRE